MFSKYLRLFSRAAISNFGRLAMPYKLSMMATYRCNSKCATCNIWKNETGHDSELSLEEWNTFFQKSNTFSWIDVSGGEISLRSGIPDIFRMILDSCESLLLLHFPTNGLLPDRIEHLCEQVAAYESAAGQVRLIVTVSIDGPPEVNDRVRGIPGGFDKAVETLKRLKNLEGVEVFVGMTLSTMNIGKLDATVDAISQRVPGFGWDDLHLNVVHTSEHYLQNTEVESAAENAILGDIARFLEHRGRGLDLFGWVERVFLGKMPGYLVTGETPMPCQAFNSTCFVDPSGNVYPCSIYNMKVGNLRDVDYDLKQLWDSPRAREVVEAVRAHKCPDCWTACEAYPAIAGNVFKPWRLLP